MNPSNSPRILSTTVGSYPVPDWLAALPSEQALLDATRVVFNLQRQAGIDLPTDGELYRFDVNHPDTNGMIEYFVDKFGGARREVGRSDTAAFRAKTAGRWRARRRSRRSRAGGRAGREGGAFLFRQLWRTDGSKRRLDAADFFSQPSACRPSRARTRPSPALRS